MVLKKNVSFIAIILQPRVVYLRLFTSLIKAAFKAKNDKTTDYPGYKAAIDLAADKGASVFIDLPSEDRNIYNIRFSK